MRNIKMLLIGSVLTWVLLMECFSASGKPEEKGSIRYVGSSTISHFIVDAQQEFQGIDFLINTKPESYGGQQIILTGDADVAGVAGEVDPEIKNKGIVSTMIGKDAIAVIVNRVNPVKNLSINQIKDIFTGRITNWKEVGGYDIPIRPLIVGPKSATREIFRKKVLGNDNYQGYEVIEPDGKMIEKVAQSEGAIGQISFSFLVGERYVKPLYVNGQEPSVTNFDYLIFRPLYLLSKGQPEGKVKEFMDWALGREGQRVIMRRFIGVNILASIRPKSLPPRVPVGYLKVYTETFQFEDSDIYYYPHKPYSIFDLYGEKIHYIRNHRNNYDEEPVLVKLPPGKYLVVPEGRKKLPEILVTVEEEKITEVNIEEISRAR